MATLNKRGQDQENSDKHNQRPDDSIDVIVGNTVGKSRMPQTSGDKDCLTSRGEDGAVTYEKDSGEKRQRLFNGGYRRTDNLK